jgi:hypothetical protein
MLYGKGNGTGWALHKHMGVDREATRLRGNPLRPVRWMPATFCRVLHIVTPLRE